MDYSLYFQRAPEGEKPNQYQYNGPNDHPEWFQWLNTMLFVSQRMDLDNKVFIDQSDSKVDFINSFLKYHFDLYTGSADQFMICLNTIKLSLKQLIEKGPPPARDFWGPKYELYTPIIDKWINDNEVKQKRNKPS